MVIRLGWGEEYLAYSLKIILSKNKTEIKNLPNYLICKQISSTSNLIKDLCSSSQLYTPNEEEVGVGRDEAKFTQKLNDLPKVT